MSVKIAKYMFFCVCMYRRSYLIRPPKIESRGYPSVQGEGFAEVVQPIVPGEPTPGLGASRITPPPSAGLRNRKRCPVSWPGFLAHVAFSSASLETKKDPYTPTHRAYHSWLGMRFPFGP